MGTDVKGHLESIKVTLSGPEKTAAAIQTILELVPLGIGGAINTAVFGTMATRQAKRLEMATEQLAEQLKVHADKIDKRYFETDEFQSVFRRCYETFAREHQDLKHRAATNVLLRNTLEGDPTNHDFDVYVLSLLNDLTPVHLVVLSELSRPITVETRKGPVVGFHDPEALAGTLKLDLEVMYGVLGHLKGLGLVVGQAGMGMMGGAMVSVDVSFALTATGRLVLGRLADPPPSKGAISERPSG